jgi:hypothetical protein
MRMIRRKDPGVAVLFATNFPLSSGESAGSWTLKEYSLKANDGLLESVVTADSPTTTRFEPARETYPPFKECCTGAEAMLVENRGLTDEGAA